jgi:cytidine deaminase
MKMIFTESYEDLKNKLSEIDGEWDESQPNKKALRLNSGVMNWYETTGTINFQGKEGPKRELEKLVALVLNIEIKPGAAVEITVDTDKQNQQTDKGDDNVSKQFLEGRFDTSEIIIGIVSAVGTESSRVITPLTDRLRQFSYMTTEIRVSSLLKSSGASNEYERIKNLMKAGDCLRSETSNNAILAYGSAKIIDEKREETAPQRAFIVNSLKHPDEVGVLRKIYGQGFYLFGIHTDKKRRLHYLINDKGLTSDQATELTDIDEDERISHGQRTRDTYHLSDFFINFGRNDDQVKNTIQRFLELIFSHPYKNPTFDEFAMFMAFSSSVRSGDLSRQVGAVISKNQQIVATGANDCPVSGGGLYWAEVDEKSGEVTDKIDGKDYTRNEDSNKAEQKEIIHEIMTGASNLEGVTTEQFENLRDLLETSRIRDLTEFGRVVHAEMEAILSCGRSGISCVDGTLYCTTFPCHNCAKHIIAAGIKRVVYVEPYPKSKALEFHSDSIELRTKLDEESDNNQVVFEPFTGVGTRRFLDFFSMNLGAGNKLKRKNKNGSTVEWERSTAKARVALLPESYREVERSAVEIFINKTSHNQ